MPRKLRELISDLESAGFKDRGGKGSHRNFIHPKVPKIVTLSGNPGDDAKRTRKGRWRPPSRSPANEGQFSLRENS